MKKIFKALLLLAVLFGLFGIYRVLVTPTSVYPFPYTISEIPYPDLNRAENCDILIVGDRMGLNLENLKPSLLKELSEDFSPDIDIFNWAEENEGLHRTIDKLSKLKKIPQIVIYQGGSGEFYEKKFNLDQYEGFLKNLKRYQNPKMLSLILAFPLISKIIYSNTNAVKIGPIVQRTQGEQTGEKTQRAFEMEYYIFELEMEKLVKMAIEKNFFLFILTTPLNLKIPPKEICSNSTSPSLESEQKEISNLIKKGSNKEAFERVSALGKKIEGNAQNYFLLGMALEGMGKFLEAVSALNQGTAFDCYPWRSNIVFNNIIRTKTGEKNIYMVDFDKIVNQNFGIRELFLNELYPNEEAYDLLGPEIGSLIGKIFKR